MAATVDQTVLKQIKQALFQDDPEWAAAFNKQVERMTKEEEVAMKTLDTVFWSLTAEGTDPEDVKGEVEEIFQQLRARRCQQQLRDQIVPLIRKLPREFHKDVLAEVMDSFGDLTLSDEEVLLHAHEMVSNLKADSPPKPAIATKEPKDSKENKKSKGDGGEGDGKKKKKKKPKEGDASEPAELVKKIKKTKKGTESTPQSPQGTELRAATADVLPVPEPTVKRQVALEPKSVSSGAPNLGGSASPVPPTTAVPITTMAPTPSPAAQAVPEPKSDSSGAHKPPTTAVPVTTAAPTPSPASQVAPEPKGVSSEVPSTHAASPDHPPAPGSSAVPTTTPAVLPSATQVDSADAKAVLTATTLLLAQLHASQGEAARTLDVHVQMLQQREKLAIERELALERKEQELEDRAADLQLKELELDDLRRQLEEQQSQSETLYGMVQEQQKERDEAQALRQQVEAAVQACEEALQKSAASERELVEKQRYVHELRQHEASIAQQLHSTKVFCLKAEARVDALTAELKAKAQENVVLLKKQEDLLVQVAALRQELSEKASFGEQLTKRVVELTEEAKDRHTLLQKLQALEADHKKLQQACERSAVWSLHSTELTQKLKFAREEARTAEEHVQQLSQDLEAKAQQCAQLEAAVSELLPFRQLARDLQGVEEEMLCRRHEVREMMEQCRLTESRLRKSDRLASHLQRQLERAELRIGDLLEENEELLAQEHPCHWSLESCILQEHLVRLSLQAVATADACRLACIWIQEQRQPPCGVIFHFLAEQWTICEEAAGEIPLRVGALLECPPSFLAHPSRRPPARHACSSSHFASARRIPCRASISSTTGRTHSIRSEHPPDSMPSSVLANPSEPRSCCSGMGSQAGWASSWAMDCSDTPVLAAYPRTRRHRT
eukprot:GGOE01002033.1.p1 GENE.GGOE01002033.1~~GGOE01002033.1.p1  ORF type:complete len:919 (-),score=215.32 GGOE01002033.1:271-2967(-)